MKYTLIVFTAAFLLIGSAQAAPCAAAHCVSVPLVRGAGSGTVAVMGQPFSYPAGDYLYIIGQVQNTTTKAIKFVHITANLFDAQSKLVATTSTFSRIRLLPPNTSSCFIELVKAPADWASIQFEKPNYDTTDDTPASLGILNDSGAYDPIAESYKLLGQVRNDEAIKVEFVNVTATLFDATGQAVGCESTFVSSTDLDPGQISSFSITTFGRDASDVASYRLQVQGDK